MMELFDIVVGISPATGQISVIDWFGNAPAAAATTATAHRDGFTDITRLRRTFLVGDTYRLWTHRYRPPTAPTPMWEPPV